MTRNMWWLAAGVLALTLTGGARAEEDCCAQKCAQPCATRSVRAVTLPTECTCEGKDKTNCKCAKCKCEPAPSSKCTCEGKDKDQCICDKCKCMKKVEKIVTLGKTGVLILRWVAGAPTKAKNCCSTTVTHNGSAECAESGCCAGHCPLRAWKKVEPQTGNVMFGIGVNSEAGVSGNMVLHGNQMVHPFVMHGPMAMPMPLFPHPVPPPFLPSPFAMPMPPQMMTPPAPVYHPAAVSSEPVLRCATVAVPPPAVSAMRFVVAEGQVKLEMQHGDSFIASERMKMTVGEGCAVQVCAEGNQVSIRCECLTARADSVIKTGKGDRIVLEGNVKFRYTRGKQVVEATADRVVCDPSTGQCEIKASE